MIDDPILEEARALALSVNDILDKRSHLMGLFVLTISLLAALDMIEELGMREPSGVKELRRALDELLPTMVAALHISRGLIQ